MSELAVKISEKKVNFNTFVSVILVPGRNDLKSIENNIWWCKKDYEQMELYAISDLRSFILTSNIIHLDVDPKRMLNIARTKLYQLNQGKELKIN